MKRLLIASALAAAIAPGQAQAQDFPDDAPSFDQYVPSLPIAEGRQVPGAGPRDGAAPAPLPPSTRAELAGSEDGELLARAATDPSLGAPSRGSARSGASSAATIGEGADAGGGSLLSIAGDALTGGGGLAVALLLLATGGAGATVAFARRRSRS